MMNGPLHPLLYLKSIQDQLEMMAVMILTIIKLNINALIDAHLSI